MARVVAKCGRETFFMALVTFLFRNNLSQGVVYYVQIMPEPLVKRGVTYRGKCIVCGDSTVGKSALTQVYCSDGAQYPKTYTMTTGVDLTVKNIHLPDSPDSVEMFLYDTAGKDVYEDLVAEHLKDTKMVVYVYDVSSEESFKNIVEWQNKVEAVCPGVPSVLVGNKSDLTERQVISSTLGEELAVKLKMTFFECSAKEMRNVDAPFIHLAKSYHSKQSEVE